VPARSVVRARGEGASRKGVSRPSVESRLPVEPSPLVESRPPGAPRRRETAAPVVAPRVERRRPAVPAAVPTPTADDVAPVVDGGERLRELAATVIGEEGGVAAQVAAPVVVERGAMPVARRGAAAGVAPTLVRVSIGRVDVRAPAQAVPATETRARAHGPTALHDYLGRRNGTAR
jgi:hypothetical protein